MQTRGARAAKEVHSDARMEPWRPDYIGFSRAPRHFASDKALSFSRASPQPKLQYPKYLLLSSQPEWRKSRTVIVDRLGLSNAIGVDSETSKVTWVPDQADAGLDVGWLLMHSHSTRSPARSARTFICRMPCGSPKLNCSTDPTRISTSSGLSHQLPIPFAVEIASYSFPVGPSIRT